MTELICKPFERTDGVYILKDAICLTQAEWDVISPEEVTVMEDTRWVNWLAIIAAPPIESSSNEALPAEQLPEI